MLERPTLTLIQMAIKKCVAVRLGVIFDSQMTNRKQEGLLVRAPLPPPHFYLSLGTSYMTPSQLEYTKTPKQTGGSSDVLIEKSPKTAFFYIKAFNKI
jgi:hypothetical protein